MVTKLYPFLLDSKAFEKQVGLQAPAGSSQHPNFPSFFNSHQVPAIFLLEEYDSC